MRQFIAQRTHLDFRPIKYSMQTSKNQAFFTKKFNFFLAIFQKKLPASPLSSGNIPHEDQGRAANACSTPHFS